MAEIDQDGYSHWMHKDPTITTTRSTDSSGAAYTSFFNGNDLEPHELDHTGKAIAFADPYVNTSYYIPADTFFIPGESMGTVINGSYTTFTLDGVNVPESRIKDQIELIYGGIFGYVEQQAFACGFPHRDGRHLV